MTKQMPVHFLLFCFLLLYLGIGLPLQAKNEVLRTEVGTERKLALQLANWDSQLHGLLNKDQPFSSRKQSERLELLQASLESEVIKPYLTQVTVVNGSGLRCRFEKVNFDSLMRWLEDFSEREKVSVAEASIERLTANGEVKVELVLNP